MKNIDFTKYLPPEEGEAEVKTQGGIDFSRYIPEPDPETPIVDRNLTDYGRDAAGMALNAAITVPETAVGILDIPTLGRVGKLVESTGVRFKDAHDIVNNDIYSEQTKEAKKKVSQAEGDGFVDTVWQKAKTAVQNPSTIVTGVAESLPSMFLGGGLGKGAVKGAELLASKYGVGGNIMSKMGSLGTGAQGAIGESLVSGGQTAEQIRQESKDGNLTAGQAGISLASGALTGTLTKVANVAARKLGIGDIDELVVKAYGNTAVDAAEQEAAKQAAKGFIRKTLEGVATEGALQELPQSMQEQVAQNLAQGKPLDEGLSDAAAMGFLTGGVLGGGAAHFGGGSQAPQGPSQSSTIAQNAFADVRGDQATLAAQKDTQSRIATALASMSPEEQSQAIAHMSQGDQQLAQKLTEAAQHPELLAQGGNLARANTQDGSGNPDFFKSLEVAHQIRLDSGIIQPLEQNNQGTDANTAAQVAQQVSQGVDQVAQNQGQVAQPVSQQPLNSAGFVSELPENLKAQLLSVHDGVKPAIFVSQEDLQHVNLAGLEQAEVVDPNTGDTGIIASKSREIVQKAAQRADQVGLKQAVGEAMGYADPTQTSAPSPDAVVVQQHDAAGNVIHEETVTPENVGNVTQLPGAQISMKRVEDAIRERTQQPATTAEQAQNTQNQAQTAPKPTVASTAVAQNVTPKANQAEAQALVQALNSSSGLTGDNAVDPASITAVEPHSKPLKRMAQAIKHAFGINVVFVHSATGGPVSLNGKALPKFNGLAVRGRKTIYINTATTHPVMNLLGHELTHILQVQHPDLYEKLEIAALMRVRFERAMKFKSDLSRMMDEEGNQGNIEQRIQELRDELVAEAIGEMATDGKFWGEVFGQIKGDQQQARNLFDRIMEVLGKMAKAFSNGGFIEGLKDLKAVRSSATEAYLEWSRRTAEEADLTDAQAAPQPSTLSQKDKADTNAELRQSRAVNENTMGDIVVYPKGDIRDNELALKIINDGHTPSEKELDKNPLVKNVYTRLAARIEEAKALKPSFDEELGALAERMGVGYRAGPVKLMQKSFKKVWGEYFVDQIGEGASPEEASLIAASKIKDLLRSTFIFEAPSQASTVVKNLEGAFPGQKVKRNLWDAKEDPDCGYRDILMNLKFKGFVSEVQANTEEMAKAKEGEGHKLYDAWDKLRTSYPKPRPEEIALKMDELTERQRAIYTPAYELALRNESMRNKKSSRVSVAQGSPEITQSSPRSMSEPSGLALENRQQAAPKQAMGRSSSSTQKDVYLAESKGKSGFSQPEVASIEGSVNDTYTDHSTGLLRFSRANILAVMNGNKIAPLAVLDAPTESMVKSGLDRRLPIRIEASVVDKLLTGKDGLRRKMTPDEIMSLQERIKKPVAIFDDPTDKGSIVIATDMMVDGEPVVVAINKTPIEKTYDITAVDAMGRATRGATTEKAKFSPLKTAYSKNVEGMLRWVEKTKIKHFDMALAKSAYGGDYMRLVNEMNLKSIRDKAYRVKEVVGQPLGQTPFGSAPSASTLKRDTEELARPTTQSVSQPARIASRPVLSLRKSRVYTGVPLSTAPLMQQDAILSRRALGLKETGKGSTLNKVRDIAVAMNNATKAMFGAMNPNDLTQTNAGMMAAAMADEISFQLGTNDETGTGTGWYSTNYPAALDVLSKRFPELKKNKNARMIFTAIVAVTSNGERVDKNISNAVKLYAEYREGRPLVAMNNRRMGALENKLAQIEALVERFGFDGMRKELEREVTVAEMNRELRARGEDADSSYKADTLVPVSAIYFGPKLGAFYANLMGSEGYLTMDLWWSRTMNRMRGLLIPKATESSLETLRILMGTPSMSRDETAEASKQFALAYEDNGFFTDLEKMVGKKQPGKPPKLRPKNNQADWEAKVADYNSWNDTAVSLAGERFNDLMNDHKLMKAANTIYKNEFLMLEEAPFHASDREFMYKVARMAQANLAEKGTNLTLADVQAAIWYYEKRLYQHLSGRKADDIGYEEAIKSQSTEDSGRAGPSTRFSGKPVRGSVTQGEGVENDGLRGKAEKPTAVRKSRDLERLDAGEDVRFARLMPPIAEEDGLIHVNGRTYEPRNADEPFTKEGNKKYLKRVIDTREAPKSLPYEPKKFFKLNKNSINIPMSDIVSSKSDEENLQGGTNAPKRFLAAYDGIVQPRGPIAVKQREDGKYDILDGNGTFTAFKNAGWESIPANVFDNIEEAEAAEKSEPYAAYGLKDADQTAVLSKFAPTHPRVIADHITLASGEDVKMADMSPKTGRVIGISDHEGLQAAVVEIDGQTENLNNEPYHITISTEPNARSSKAGEMIERNGYTAVEPFEIDLSQGANIRLSRLQDDLEAQTVFLETKAKEAGYKDIEELLQNDYDKFVELATQWREIHPEEVMYSRQMDTPELKKWFGDSKVVDADGKPLVVYHGTVAKFDVFDLAKFGATDAGWYGKGFYFTDDKKVAKQYGKAMAVYLSIERPMSADQVAFSQEVVERIAARAKELDPDFSMQTWQLSDIVGEKGAIDQLEGFYRAGGNPEKILRAFSDVTGFDGVTPGKGIYIAFNPTQIKSATGNNGNFDGSSPDIRMSRANPDNNIQDTIEQLRRGKIDHTMTEAYERGQIADAVMKAKNPGELKEAMSKMGDGLVKMFADSMLSAKQWIKDAAIDPMLKQRMDGDLYRANNIRGYLESEVQEKFTNHMYKAIEKAAQTTKLDVDFVKVASGRWMSAMYAPKANSKLILKDRVALATAVKGGDPVKILEARNQLNTRIAEVNGRIRPRGVTSKVGLAGGMNNAEAAELRRVVESQIPVAMLNKIAAPIYGMMEWKRAKDLESGKVTQTMVNSWAKDLDYVPLTGDPRYNGTSDDVFNSGNQVNQDAEKAMNGRKESVADDAIDAAIGATLRSINHYGLQDFKRSLNQAYLDAAAAGVDIGLERKPITGVNRTSDDVILYRDTAVTASGTQKTIAYALTFSDKRVMEGIKKENVERVPAVIKILAKGTSVYGGLVTQMMAMFAPINLVRDIWERSEIMRVKKLLNQSGAQVNLDKAARHSIADVINPALWTATISKSFKLGGMRGARGDLEELIRLGGASLSRFALARSSAALEKDIRGSTGMFNQGVAKLQDFVHAYNAAFELVPSLAIYRSLKAQGVAPKDAAAFTLDLMNFGKRGTVMPSLKSLYVFAQPAAQSGYNLAQYLATPKGRARFAAQTIISVALYAMLKAQWGPDDDEENANKIDNLSNYITDRSIPIKMGNTVVKVPVGFGPPQLAWLFGTITNRYLSGRYEAKDALAEAAKGWIKTVAPISPSDIELSKRPVDWLAQTFTPTMLKPIVNIFSDQNALGSPLTPQFMDPKKMKFEQARRSTPQAYSDIAKELYDMTGVDMYPDHIKAISDGYLVGPWRELITMYVHNPAKEMRGEPIQIPLVHQLVDNINDRQMLNSIYYRYRQPLQDAYTKVEYLKREAPDQLTPELQEQARAFASFKTAESMISQQRSALKRNKSMDEDARALRTQTIEERSDAAHRRVLSQYLATLEK